MKLHTKPYIQKQLNEYTITWQDHDGSPLGTSTVTHGVTPTYPNATPSRPATAQYTYTFTGWTPEVVAATGEATYKAVYSETINQYAVVFEDYNGTSIQSENLNYGATIVAPTNPVRAGYKFTGWNPAFVEHKSYRCCNICCPVRTII